MGDKAKLRVRVISQFRVLYDGYAERVSTVDKTGPIDIFPGHEELVGILSASDLSVHSDKGQQAFKVSSGLIHIAYDMVDVFISA